VKGDPGGRWGTFRYLEYYVPRAWRVKKLRGGKKTQDWEEVKEKVCKTDIVTISGDPRTESDVETRGEEGV